MAHMAIPGGRDTRIRGDCVDEKSPLEVCRDCEYRHTYCHASCEVYHDIIRNKAQQKEARKASAKNQEAESFLIEQAIKTRRKKR